MNDMEKLTYFEKEILKSITKFYPHTLELNASVYERCGKSFDKTIAIIEAEMKLGCGFDIIFNVIEKFDFKKSDHGNFTEQDMERAWNDGAYAEEQRCGNFDIENYR